MRASILYFVLNDLSLVDPMYQFSLDAYIDLFLISIRNSPKNDNLQVGRGREGLRERRRPCRRACGLCIPCRLRPKP